MLIDIFRTCRRASDVFQYIIMLQVLSSLFILITCLYVAASVSAKLYEYKFSFGTLSY